jgi:hypothetical protein
LYREHCIKTEDNVYIKDLRVFKNRDLKDMIIVDNAVYSFGAQLSNGIPITPFKDDKDDTEFLFLIEYLTNIMDIDDYREANKDAFKMEKVYKFNLNSCIDQYEYRPDDDSLDLDDGKSDVEYTSRGGTTDTDITQSGVRLKEEAKSKETTSKSQ